ncbi:MAG: diguanylate cyclase, partial [Elusimicrobia bacterium]|nr:diguanylate cyclase [Elusimicrobiota bacterium]
MLSASLVGAAVMAYIAALFILAAWVENRPAVSARISASPIVYALTLMVYCSDWTFYGCVGNAVTSGFLFFTFYLGPTLAAAAWRPVLGRLIRIKNAHRITSIADLISARYGKSQTLAVLATLGACMGSLPYLAVQFKAINVTMQAVTHPIGFLGAGYDQKVGVIILAAIILFTIGIGLRRLDPTERHPGVMLAMAVQCLVKLGAFLAVGAFVAFFLFNGVGDIFRSAAASPGLWDALSRQAGSVPYSKWAAYLLLSASAFFFLPRQFHVAVVENADERHVRTAIWLAPLYMLLLSAFVYPLAVAGLLRGLPVEKADSFVLLLPMAAGAPYLVLLAFLGGFSAAMGMIITNSMAITTMATNHLLLPLIERVERFGFLRRHLLYCKWGVVALYLSLGHWFASAVGPVYKLVDLGIIAFLAALQAAPAVLGGMFWRKGNRRGAAAGLAGGLLVWFYVMLVPAFVKSGWLPQSLLSEGPFGWWLLRPENLFGVGAFEPVVHGVFWSLAANIGLYVAGSLCCRSDPEEEEEADDFV